MRPRHKGETALVIGYGNTSRRDDGVGYHVVDALNARLGRPSLGELSSDPADQAGDIHTIWLHQLAPELAETVASYDLVVFVDAHRDPCAPDLHIVPLTSSYHSAMISHHLHPETLLALTRDLYGRVPRAVLVSVRGYDFDFGSELSPSTGQLVAGAVEYVSVLVGAAEAAIPSSESTTSES